MNKSSAIAQMAAQCCTIRIFTVEWVLLFNTLVLSYLWEYCHKSCTARN